MKTTLAVFAAAFTAIVAAGCSSTPACHHASHTCRAVQRGGQVEYVPIFIPAPHPVEEPDPVVVDGGDG